MTKGLILAAGRGSRLKDVTDDRPKCMVELNGRPLLDYQITSLKNAGIQDIAVVCGYLKEKVQHPFLNHKFFNIEWERSNMVSSLFCADEWLSGDTCLVSYGDIFYQPTIVKLMLECTEDLCISFDPDFMTLWEKRFNNPWEDLESFRRNEDGYLVDIGQKVKKGDTIEGQYMGLLKFTPRSWSEIKKVVSSAEVKRLDMTSLLRKLISHGIKIKTIPNNGLWGEVDDQKDLSLYQELFSKE